MSALNAFVRPDGAWLMADTAGYDHDGNVLGFGSKIVASEDLRMLVGRAGRSSTDASEVISAWMALNSCQQTAIAELPALLELLAEHDAEAMANGAAETCGPIPAGLRLVVALWDPISASAKAMIISTVADLGSTPPYTLRPLKTLFSPPLSGDPWPGHTFEPDSDAGRLAGLQRLETDERGIHRVGGEFEAWRVYAGGVERRVVCRWPDVVGETLRLAA